MRNERKKEEERKRTNLSSNSHLCGNLDVKTNPFTKFLSSEKTKKEKKKKNCKNNNNRKIKTMDKSKHLV